MRSVYDVFCQAATRWPERPMLNTLPETADIYEIAAGEVTYGAAVIIVAQLAKNYSAAGYTKGHRVLLLLENRPAFFYHWLALNSLGCSVVPMNPDLRAAELDYLIAHCEPAAACSAGRQMDLAAVGALFGPDDPPLPPTRVPNGAPNEAAMLYTSGTTGHPKGCILNDDYFTLCGEWYRDAGGRCAIFEDAERMITPLPVFHMNAMACSFMAMITVGGSLCVLDRFHPRTWWQSVRKSRATCLHYLGVMPSMLMGSEPGPDDTNHSVRFGFGAGIDPKLHGPFEQRFNIPLVEGWGMTETGMANAIVANHPPFLTGQCCLGLPSPDNEVRLVDEQGMDVPVNAPGELLIRRSGPDPKRGFFDHYYKDPQATSEAWQGGWFHTGDLVRRDEENRFFFVDRKKNIIRRSGENIAAAEVESVLMKHPLVSSAGVTSVPDDIRGEEVFALLCIKKPSGEAAVQITKWCLEQLAYYKAPGYIHFVSALPLTGTQKIQRGILKARAADLLCHHDTHTMVHLKKRQS